MCCTCDCWSCIINYSNAHTNATCTCTLHYMYLPHILTHVQYTLLTHTHIFSFRTHVISLLTHHTHAAFCAFYCYDGVLRERPFEVLAYVVAVIVIIIYTIGNFGYQLYRINYNNSHDNNSVTDTSDFHLKIVREQISLFNTEKSHFMCSCNTCNSQFLCHKFSSTCTLYVGT